VNGIADSRVLPALRRSLARSGGDALSQAARPAVFWGRRWVRVSALLLAIVSAGLVITGLVTGLVGTSSLAAAGTAVKLGGAGAPGGSVVVIPLWALATVLVAAGVTALGLMYVGARRRQMAAAAVRAGGRQVAADLLTVLMEKHASREEQGQWEALLAAVGRMQRELDQVPARGQECGAALDLGVPAARRILDALSIGIVRLDQRDRLVYANQSAVRLLRLRNLDDPGVALQERLAQPALAETLLGLRHHIGAEGVDCRLGQEQDAAVVRLTPIKLGPPCDELIVSIQDITELKKAERSRDELLAHITHELRTPLTNIRAYAETLSGDLFDDKQTQRECYQVISAETGRLSKLIEDLLSVSQVDAGAARLTRSSVQLDELMRQAVRDLQASADAKSVELTLEVHGPVPMISGDRIRLHQVGVNLISNAIKYTAPGGAVLVRVSGGEQSVRLDVADTGVGIAPQWRERIFEKFFRVPNAALDRVEGTGLGLAIVRDVVRLHGGTIAVDSIEDTGTTFTVELPIVASTPGPQPAGNANGAHRDR